MNDWKRITAVAVAHRSVDVIGTCLKSAAPANAMIVVGNTTDDGSSTAARAALPPVVVVPNPVTQGFAGVQACSRRP